jgi:hypothetical protein
MTAQQYHVLEMLRTRDYDPTLVRRENHDVLRVVVRRKMRAGLLFLHIAGDGTYRDAGANTRLVQVRSAA